MSARANTVPEPQRSGLALLVVALLLAAAALSAYLLRLHVAVAQAGPENVDSFCNLSELASCTTVAASPYASLLGVPMAAFGLEFYGLTAIVVLLALRRGWPISRWATLATWAMLLALPVSLTMAYLAFFRLRAICVLCCALYAINVAVLLLLLLVHRGRLRALIWGGLRELGRWAARPRAMALLTALLVLAFSQLIWLPPLLGAPAAQRSADGKLAIPHSTATGLVLGPANAPVRIVEFSDFECGVCKRAHEVVVELQRRYAGALRFEHHDFPLDQACNRSIDRPFHASACAAALQARCAAKEQRFGPFAALLYHQRGPFSAADFVRYAERLGLRADKLERCARSAEMRRQLLNDIEEGLRRKLKGTPTFFLNGEEIIGLRDLAWWQQKIAGLIGPKAGSGAPPPSPRP